MTRISLSPAETSATIRTKSHKPDFSRWYDVHSAQMRSKFLWSDPLPPVLPPLSDYPRPYKTDRLFVLQHDAEPECSLFCGTAQHLRAGFFSHPLFLWPRHLCPAQTSDTYCILRDRSVWPLPLLIIVQYHISSETSFIQLIILNYCSISPVQML